MIMKTLWITTIFCSLIAVPAFSQASLTSEDLDKIRLIVKDEVAVVKKELKQEIADSEARMKDYVNVRFDSVDKRFDSVEKEILSVDKRVTYGINVTYGLIALIVVAIGIPQFISVLQGRRQKEFEQKLQDLYRKIEMLEQQRIVSP